MKPAHLIASCVLVALGCASTGEVQFEQKPGEHSTPDGLYPVKESYFSDVKAFARPGVDLRSYDKVMIDDLTIRYKRGSYRPDEAKVERLQKFYREEFERHLRESRNFAIVTEPGPDVLRLDCQLQNVEVTVPGQAAGDPKRGREHVALRSAAYITMVLELSDSESDEPLVRVGQRRRVRAPFEDRPPTPTIGAMANSDMQEMFRNFALRLTDWLDHVHDIPPLPHPPETGEGAGDANAG